MREIVTNLYLFVIGFLLSLSFACGAVAQIEVKHPQRTPSEAGAAPPYAATPASQIKPPKVWTNDDLRDSRKPENIKKDRDSDAKEPGREIGAQPEGVSAATAVATSPTSTLSNHSPLPRTVEEAQRKVSAAADEIVQMQATLESLRDRYAGTTDDLQRAKLQLNIDLIRSDLGERHDDLTLLQNRLEVVKSAKAAPPVPQD